MQETSILKFLGRFAGTLYQTLQLMLKTEEDFVASSCHKPIFFSILGLQNPPDPLEDEQNEWYMYTVWLLSCLLWTPRCLANKESKNYGWRTKFCQILSNSKTCSMSSIVDFCSGFSSFRWCLDVITKGTIFLQSLVGFTPADFLLQMEICNHWNSPRHVTKHLIKLLKSVSTPMHVKKCLCYQIKG